MKITDENLRAQLHARIKENRFDHYGTLFTDGKRIVEIAMVYWSDSKGIVKPDWSIYYFDDLDGKYDDDLDAYVVDDIDRYIECAQEWPEECIESAKEWLEDDDSYCSDDEFYYSDYEYPRTFVAEL